MKKYLVLLVPLLLGLMQCRKPLSTDATISGRILELGSDKPIEAAKVILTEPVSSCLFCPQTQKEIAYVITDASGKYSFAYQDTTSLNWLTVFSKNNTFYERRSIEIPRTTFGTALSLDTFNIRLTPPAWMKLHFVNQNPVDERDIVRFSAFLDITTVELQGKNVDTIIVGRCMALTNNRIHKVVVKSGITTISHDSITIGAHDTISYEVRY